MGGMIVGKAYVPGYGLCYVEATEKKDFFVTQTIHAGIRHWVSRDRVQWRR